MRTHYQNLHVSEKASPEVVRAAYKALAQKWHPDRNPEQREKAERYFKIITAAYEVLSDPKTRAEYDASLAADRYSEHSPEPNPKTDSSQSYQGKGAPSSFNEPASNSVSVRQGKSIYILLSILAVIFICAWGAFGSAIGKVIAGYFSPSPTKSAISQLNKFADEENRKLPAMLDDVTRLDRLSIGPGVRTNYHHTLVSVQVGEIDKSYLSGFLRSQISSKVCANGDMRTVMRNGGTYSYIYRDKNGVDIFQIDLSESDCSALVAGGEVGSTPDEEGTAQTQSVRAESPTEHYEKIYSVHPDADEIVNSHRFSNWVSWSPERVRIMDQGSAEEIVSLFSGYKQHIIEHTPELDDYLDSVYRMYPGLNSEGAAPNKSAIEDVVNLTSQYASGGAGPIDSLQMAVNAVAIKRRWHYPQDSLGR